MTICHSRQKRVQGESALVDRPLVNGDFSSDLITWVSEILGGGSNPGTITVDPDGRALLLENGSFLVSLQQTFKLPDNTRQLSFEVYFDPGFDLADNFFPDAFEVQLLDAATNDSVVPTWDPLATSFFNVQENLIADPTGAVNLAAGVTIEDIDGDGLPAFRVHLDLTGVAAGTEVTLFNDLIGADSDTGSGVRLDNFILNTQPPSSDPGGPYAAECNAAGVTIQLDGSASVDPDGNEITYAWSTDCPGASLSDPAVANPILTLPGGVTDCQVTLTVSDGVWLAATQAAMVAVEDTTPPQLTCAAPLTLPATAIGGVPVADVGLSASAADDCSAVTMEDDRPLDFFPLGDTDVTFVARDEAGNDTECSTRVRVTLPDRPLIQCPAAVNIDACANNIITVDEVELARALILAEGPAEIVDDRPQIFPAGQTRITFMVVDKDGDTAECQTTVTVRELGVDDPACPTGGGGLRIECAPAVRLRVCPDEELTRDRINLEPPMVDAGGGSFTIRDDAPEEFLPGVTEVVFTIATEDGVTATCTTDVLVELEDPGAAPCQGIPPITDLIQERITTTTIQTGICGSCGAVGFLPFMLTVLGIQGLKLTWRRRRP